MRRDYSDIIDRERPVSEKHPPMDRMMRAAQFAPFAALTGHDDAVRETARLTEEEIELDEYEVAELNRKLQWLAEHKDTEVSVVHFVKDAKKEGGAYVKDTGILKKIDEHTHTLVLVCGQEEVQIDNFCIVRYGHNQEQQRTNQKTAVLEMEDIRYGSVRKGRKNQRENRCQL